VKIRGNKLEELAGARGMGVEDLAQAVERTGLSGERAVSAVGNWMRGSDHPRCKAEDIRKLASALQCSVGELAQFTCVLKYHRGSNRKVGLIVDLIRGKDFDTALNMLNFTTRRAAVDVKRALLAAVNDAEQADADVGRLIVTESRVDSAPTIKRFKPKDRGRAHPIKKRMSHITIGVEERN
jgi:large subunit ribosomal protein L22